MNAMTDSLNNKATPENGNGQNMGGPAFKPALKTETPMRKRTADPGEFKKSSLESNRSPEDGRDD